VIPRICVSILPKNGAEALLLTEKAESTQADLIEVRLDRLEKPFELAKLAAHGKTPKIATDKAFRKETGHRQMLIAAAQSGFDYVDVELSTPQLEGLVKELKVLGTKPIVSFHNFGCSLSIFELNRVLEMEISRGAEVCKIVTTAKQIQDNLTILNFTLTASSKAKVVCFCMGELGKVSRLLSPLFGGFFTFAALERGSETAPGQLTIQEMKASYELLGQK
jgi:3-dehydroquinate dehydratase type I